MTKQGFRIAKEIKDEIINKLKHEGLSVNDAVTQYGISNRTIYTWLGTKARGTVSLLEHNKLRKENEQLKQSIGDLTIKMSVEAKKGVRKGMVIGFSRTHQYYEHKQPAKDRQTKQQIELALRDHPSYGYRRLAIHLKMNNKVLRAMKLFGVKLYRRVTPKIYQKPKDSVSPDYLITEVPIGRGDIYANDFTRFKYQCLWLYLATLIDLYTREIAGVFILSTHAT